MRTLGAVIFPGFERLDLFGPRQMLSLFGEYRWQRDPTQDEFADLYGL